MKNNSSNDKVDGSVGIQFPPLPADAEYRNQRYQEEALANSRQGRNIGNNGNNEAPDNVSGTEPTPNSDTNNSNVVQKDTCNPTTWQMFDDL